MLLLHHLIYLSDHARESHERVPIHVLLTQVLSEEEVPSAAGVPADESAAAAAAGGEEAPISAARMQVAAAAALSAAAAKARLMADAEEREIRRIVSEVRTSFTQLFKLH